MVLEGACVNYARAVESDEILKGGCQVEEPVIDKMSGAVIGVRIKNHPAVAVSNLCWRNVQMFCSDLGLSLISRQRLSMDSTDTSNSSLTEKLLRPRPEEPEPTVQ